MIDVLYEKMTIPGTCRIGKRVFKKLFHENAKLSLTDKKALSEDVDTILWQYIFKSTTIPIMPYDDDQREYHEVALLQVNLKRLGKVNRLAEIIHKAIPYPLIVVFVSETICAISLAHKRFSQAERDSIVAEDFQTTCWIDLLNLTIDQVSFLESMNVTTWPFIHFFAFYRAAMNCVVALACAEHSGHYSLESANGHSLDEQIFMLKHIDELQQEKTGIQHKLKKEKNLGTQVQLNMQIKQINDHIKETISKL